MAWTPDQEEQLRELWAMGKPASQIVAAMSVDGGKPINRDMVIGKARRMGLAPRPSPIQRREEV